MTLPMLQNDHKRDIVVYSCVLYFGVIANIVVLYSLWRTWRQGSRGQYFFLHLSISNLLALCLYLGTRIAVTATVMWVAGIAACKVVMFFSLLGVLLVNYTVVAFSVDNAIGIVTKSDGKTRRHVLQVLAWIFAIAICSTQPYFYNVLTFWFDPDYSYCVAMLPHAAEEAYHWSMIAGLYLFPIVTIVVANAVAVVMWAANRSPPLAEKPNASAIITDIRTWTLELFITIALGLVVFICWTPVAVFRMVRSEDGYQNVRNTLFFALDVFSLMTYCFIPAVYGVYRAITKTRAESTHGLEPKPTSRD